MAIAGGGEVTSGSHSPLLERGIGLGYVPSDQAQLGSELMIDVRGKHRRARVVRKPIYNKEQDGADGD
jgi:aminomethyltransferase